MSNEQIIRIKDIISNLKPSNLYVKYKRLFSINWRGQSKYEDYSDNEIYLDKERCIALREIINTYGFDSVFKLANIVESQKILAETISNELTLEEISHSLITTLLNHNCSQFSHVVLVYLYEKHSDLFNTIDSEQWEQEDWLKLFLILPATPRLWVYVDRILKDDVLSRYWMQARINNYAIYIYKTEKEALDCLNRLIGANRCSVAVNLIWRLKLLFSDLFSDEEVWELLVKVATSGDSQEAVILDRQAALCLIENLQESEALNLVQKADLEILYSVWIFDTHQSQVKATYLEKRIANEPLYYLEWYQVLVSKHINVNTNIKN
ncbi:MULTISPECIES: hypothetical protein [Xenorhabdus]|uniref:hypothetical protein n=1 Tax=Xenorhabdus TaxID=626 RepID=UPI0006490BFB|nr:MULTISPECIES: hypothetical protein [Xenorhabdus]